MLVQKCDVDANIAKASVKSGCFKILGSNKHQVILSDTETLWNYFYQGLFVDWGPDLNLFFPTFILYIYFSDKIPQHGEEIDKEAEVFSMQKESSKYFFIRII